MGQRIFISYNWNDGNGFADELEKVLKDDFDVIRDKSKLNVNDDIEDFMRGIADCDIVVLVLTSEYMKSDNCMKELSYLVDQPDWKDKVMLLVIESNLYKTDYQDEIIKYWDDELTKSQNYLEKMQRKSKNRIIEVETRESICNHLDDFFEELKKRNNPSQIAIVSEIYKLSKRDTKKEKAKISSVEKKAKKYIKEKGSITIPELSGLIGTPNTVTRRIIMRLINSNEIVRTGSKKDKWTMKD